MFAIVCNGSLGTFQDVVLSSYANHKAEICRVHLGPSHRVVTVTVTDVIIHACCDNRHVTQIVPTSKSFAYIKYFSPVRVPINSRDPMMCYK